ncbi:MAG: DNA glycosylase [Actinomycetota bacterium]|nr:DNA glycosylase [Actinomycetota bacterium]
MPEGDTVWLAAKRMNQALAGQMLTRGELRVPQLAALDLTGQTVLEVVPRGKHMLFRFADGHTLRSHFRMDGSWRIQPVGQPWKGGPAHAVRVVLSTAAVECVGFLLQELAYVPSSQEDSLVGHLGPDLLGPDWDADIALGRLGKQPDAEIGVALLDQRNLAGIGTLYRTEGLFLAGIRPQQHVGDIESDALARLVDRIRRLMLHNRERPQQSTTGSLRRGETLWIFERQGKPCRRCGTPIARGHQGPSGYERVTYWCPTCQR